MLEIIGIIASILGIIGAIWSFIKFIFKLHFKRREEFKNICNIIEDSFQRWKALEYSNRGGSMISYDNFLIVNKYRSKFNKSNKEIKAFLLINAVQNGLGGNWGFWLKINNDNESIVSPLILMLDGSAGLRPLWRSACILEKIFSENVDKIYKFIPKSEKVYLKYESALSIILNHRIENEINKISKKGSLENRGKAQMLIEEFEKFSKEINAFTKEQTIFSKI